VFSVGVQRLEMVVPPVDQSGFGGRAAAAALPRMAAEVGVALGRTLELPPALPGDWARARLFESRRSTTCDAFQAATRRADRYIVAPPQNETYCCTEGQAPSRRRAWFPRAGRPTSVASAVSRKACLGASRLLLQRCNGLHVGSDLRGADLGGASYDAATRVSDAITDSSTRGKWW
jgi:hypothetical protein